MLKKLVIPLLILGLYCLGLAIGPRVPDELQRLYCVKNISLISPFGISLNCDSFNYLEEAVNPAFLLHPRAIHQSRPGHIVVVHFAGYPVRWVTQPVLASLGLEDRLTFGLNPVGKENEFRRTTFDSPEEVFATVRLFIPYFITYFMVNIAFLALGFWLYLSLVQPGVSVKVVAWPIILIGLLLAINDVTKAYLLSPHSQVFNILVPLVALFVFVKSWYDAHLIVWVLLSAMVAVGVLSYGYFAIVIPTAVIALVLGDLSRESLNRKNVTRWIAYALLMLAITAGPYLVWYSYVVSINGTFYSFEVDCCNQIVWMAETWQQGPAALVSRWMANFWFFWRSALFGASIVYLLLIGAGLLWLNAGRPTLALTARDKTVIGGAAVVSLLTIMFYAFLGYQVVRLAYGAIVPFFVVCGVVYKALLAKTPPEKHRIAGAAVASLVILFTLFVIGKDGPWS